MCVRLLIVKDILHGNGSDSYLPLPPPTPATSHFPLPGLAVVSSRRTVNVYDTLEIVYQVREWDASLPEKEREREKSHKMSLEAQVEQEEDKDKEEV